MKEISTLTGSSFAECECLVEMIVQRCGRDLNGVTLGSTGEVSRESDHSMKVH